MVNDHIYCRSCGAQISSTALFCRKCGRQISNGKNKTIEAHSNATRKENYKENFESPHTLTLRGINLFNQQKYSEAIACYDKALRIDPRYTWALYNKSFLLSTLGRYSEAEECKKYADRLRELKIQSGYTTWFDFKCEICGGDGRKSASHINRRCPRCGKLVCSDCWSYSKMRCKKCKKYSTNISYLPFIIF